MEFIDLHTQQARIKTEIDAGIADVLSHGRYILGPQVIEFEEKLAKFADAKHALSCANGTDAILLALMAWNIGPGDAVFCPSFSYCATAEVIALRGATPVFIDIDRETYNMDTDSLRTAIAQVQRQGQLTPRAVIIVDLTSLRFHGRGTAPFDSDHIGLNSRLDTLQAAVLLPKLSIFKDEIAKRNNIAKRYSELLKPYVTRTPTHDVDVVSTWAQYTIEVPDAAKFSDALKAEGIPNARYYPLPIHMHTAYQDFPISGNGLTNTMACRNHVVSLPMHPYLSETDQDRIIEAAIHAL